MIVRLSLILIIHILLLITPLTLNAQENPNVKTKPVNSYPVKVAEKPLFNIYSGIGVFTVKERAAAIEKRLEKLGKDPTFNIDNLEIVENENSTEIVYGDSIVISFSSKDAALANMTTRELAETSLKKIQTALQTYKKDFTLNSILFGILYSFITTVVLLVIVGLLNRLIGIIYYFIGKFKDNNLITDLKFQKVNLLSAQKIEAFLKLLLIIIQVLLIASLLFIYITIVLGFFPWTSNQSGQLYKNLYAIIINILTTIALYLPNLLVILVIIVCAIFAIKFSKFIFTEIKRETIQFNWFYKEWSDVTYNLIKFFIICISIALIYPYLPGSETNAFKGVSIFLGILFSLGSTTAISNVVAGVILTYTRAFDIGERVQINNFTGDVIEKTTFVTRIKTTKNEIISIPNSKVLSSEIINFTNLSKSIGLILHSEITIGYDIPWRKIHQLLIDAALNTEHISKERPPFVLQKSLNDFYVSYEINAYTDRPDLMPKIYSILNQNIQDKFNEAGVEIMSPHYKALRDGNMSTIPQEYHQEDYKSPDFNINIKKETNSN
ncbi:MAG: mechanosensitive ion channel family protein [Cyanobacteriota bacterium]